jgi:hypothetical protein
LLLLLLLLLLLAMVVLHPGVRRWSNCNWGTVMGTGVRVHRMGMPTAAVMMSRRRRPVCHGGAR